MLALERWAEGRFKPSAMFAQVLAASSEACFEVISKTRDKPLIARDDRIGQDQWLRLYRTPQTVGAMLIHLSSDQPETQFLSESMQTFQQFQAEIPQQLQAIIRDLLAGKVSLEEVQEANQQIDDYYRSVHLPLLNNMVSGQAEPAVDFSDWLGRAEFVFFITVAAPCWLNYRETVWSLFAKACQGEFEPFEKLTRIDEYCIFEPALGEQFFRLKNRSPEQHRLLQQALQDGRETKITREKLKFSLGGLLIHWSRDWDLICKGELIHEALLKCVPPSHLAQATLWIKQRRKLLSRNATGCLLRPVDVRSLFDAVAQDTGQGLVDPDFARQPNTVQKRLKRNSVLWPSLRQTDILRAA